MKGADRYYDNKWERDNAAVPLVCPECGRYWDSDDGYECPDCGAEGKEDYPDHDY